MSAFLDFIAFVFFLGALAVLLIKFIAYLEKVDCCERAIERQEELIDEMRRRQNRLAMQLREMESEKSK